MKFTLNILEQNSEDASERRWPNYMFGGRIRTSTVALMVAFLVVWWVYDTYRLEPAPKPPPAQVVPPGFEPNPNWTWVPRDRVDKPPSTVTVAPPPITTTTTTATPNPISTTSTPPAPPPCLLPPPFCPASTTPSTTPALAPSPSQQPQPGPGPSPTSSPPAR